MYMIHTNRNHLKVTTLQTSVQWGVRGVLRCALNVEDLAICADRASGRGMRIRVLLEAVDHACRP